jgi:transposase
MSQQYTTGLADEQFEELLAAVEHIMEQKGMPTRSPDSGRPWALTLGQQLQLTLMLLRADVTQELAAAWFDVSQPTVSQTKSKLEPIIDHALAFTGIPLGEAAATRPLGVDGTHVPTGNRKQTGRSNHSGKRHCQCLSVQVACDLDGNLVAVSDPVPGARHDAAAIELAGWADTLAGANWIADSAYRATNAITPIKKEPGQKELHESERAFNKQVSQFRRVVERRISHLKNWRTLSRGYRRQLKKLPVVIALVVKLELYRIGW